MTNSFAKTISVLFHPLLMPTYCLIILFQLNTYITFTLPKNFQHLLLLLVFMNTAIFPISIIVFLVRKKILSSIYLNTKKERLFPFIMTFVFYGFTYFLLKQINFLPQPIYSLIFGAALALLLCIIINFWKKISIHMVGASGLLGGFYALSLILGISIIPVLMVFIIIIGFVASSRLQLKSHLPIEIMLGFFVGFLTEYFSVMLRIG